MLRDKLVHGASVLLGCSPLSAEQSYERLKRLPFWLRLRRAVPLW
jgi:hypothetical protein